MEGEFGEASGTYLEESYHHHKYQGFDHLICSVSRVITALSNVSSVFQLFSFLAVCSSIISKGFGFVALEESHAGFLRGDNLKGLGEDNIKMYLKETVWQQAVLVSLTTETQFHLQVSPYGIFFVEQSGNGTVLPPSTLVFHLYHFISAAYSFIYLFIHLSSKLCNLSN